MSDNLLAALQKYASRPNFNPIENFTTEAFTWLLRNDRESQVAFLELIAKQYQPKSDLSSLDVKSLLEKEEDSEIEWQTQVHLDSGFADIVGYSANFTIVVEVKVWSSGEDDQLQNYVDSLRKESKPSPIIGVVLTAATYQHNIEANSQLIWEQVYSALQKAQEKSHNDRRQEFIDFLASQGFSPVEIPHNFWRLAYDYQRALQLIPRCFQGLEKDSGLFTKDGQNNPTSEVDAFGKVSYRQRWGTYGLQFERKNSTIWNPAFFIGLVVDPTDHGIDALLENGVIFALIIDVDRKYWTSRKDSNLFNGSHLYTQTEWQNFSEELKNCAKPRWRFCGYNDGNRSVNLWHPIVVYRPVIELINEKTDAETELREVFRKNIQELLSILRSVQSFGELLKLIDSKDSGNN